MFFQIRNILVIFVICIGIIACGTGQAPCFKKDMSQTEIIWGVYNTPNKIYSGYRLTPNGEIYKYQRDSSGAIIEKYYGELDDKNVCRILGLYYWAMKTVQVCNEPGQELKFMTFANNQSNTFWNVYWNDKFKSNTNKNLRKVSDSIAVMFNKIEKK